MLLMVLCTEFIKTGYSDRNNVYFSTKNNLSHLFMQAEKKDSRPHIGANVKKLRELRNYTQDYMAQRLDISKSRYSQMEQEEDINTSYLFKIAEVLETGISRIMDFDEKQIFDIHHNSFGDHGHGYSRAENITYQSDPNIKEMLVLIKQLLEQSLNNKPPTQ
jgi:transcriptional regulator with XRE-family HTH domain